MNDTHWNLPYIVVFLYDSVYCSCVLCLFPLQTFTGNSILCHSSVSDIIESEVLSPAGIRKEHVKSESFSGEKFT